MVYNETFSQILATLPEGYSEAILGGAIGAFFVALGFIAILFVIAVYIYQAYAWMIIAKRQKHKYPWLAWIPFAASAMKLQLGKFHWAWVFLWFFPPAMIVLLTIATWRIFEKEKYGGWLSLSFPAIFIHSFNYIIVPLFVIFG